MQLKFVSVLSGLYGLLIILAALLLVAGEAFIEDLIGAGGTFFVAIALFVFLLY